MPPLKSGWKLLDPISRTPSPPAHRLRRRQPASAGGASADGDDHDETGEPPHSPTTLSASAPHTPEASPAPGSSAKRQRQRKRHLPFGRDSRSKWKRRRLQIEEREIQEALEAAAAGGQEDDDADLLDSITVKGGFLMLGEGSAFAAARRRGGSTANKKRHASKAVKANSATASGTLASKSPAARLKQTDLKSFFAGPRQANAAHDGKPSSSLANIEAGRLSDTAGAGMDEAEVARATDEAASAGAGDEANQDASTRPPYNQRQGGGPGSGADIDAGSVVAPAAPEPAATAPDVPVHAYLPSPQPDAQNEVPATRRQRPTRLSGTDSERPHAPAPAVEAAGVSRPANVGSQGPSQGSLLPDKPQSPFKHNLEAREDERGSVAPSYRDRTNECSASGSAMAGVQLPASVQPNSKAETSDETNLVEERALTFLVFKFPDDASIRQVRGEDIYDETSDRLSWPLLQQLVHENWSLDLATQTLLVNWKFPLRHQEDLDGCVAELCTHGRMLHDVVLCDLVRGHDLPDDAKDVVRRLEDRDREFWKGKDISFRQTSPRGGQPHPGVRASPAGAERAGSPALPCPGAASATAATRPPASPPLHPLSPPQDDLVDDMVPGPSPSADGAGPPRVAANKFSSSSSSAMKAGRALSVDNEHPDRKWSASPSGFPPRRPHNTPRPASPDAAKRRAIEVTPSRNTATSTPFAGSNWSGNRGASGAFAWSGGARDPAASRWRSKGSSASEAATHSPRYARRQFISPKPRSSTQQFGELSSESVRPAFVPQDVKGFIPVNLPVDQPFTSSTLIHSGASVPPASHNAGTELRGSVDIVPPSSAIPATVQPPPSWSATDLSKPTVEIRHPLRPKPTLSTRHEAGSSSNASLRKLREALRKTPALSVDSPQVSVNNLGFPSDGAPAIDLINKPISTPSQQTESFSADHASPNPVPPTLGGEKLQEGEPQPSQLRPSLRPAGQTAVLEHTRGSETLRSIPTPIKNANEQLSDVKDAPRATINTNQRTKEADINMTDLPSSTGLYQSELENYDAVDARSEASVQSATTDTGRMAERLLFLAAGADDPNFDYAGSSALLQAMHSSPKNTIPNAPAPAQSGGAAPEIPQLQEVVSKTQKDLQPKPQKPKGRRPRKKSSLMLALKLPSDSLQKIVNDEGENNQYQSSTIQVAGFTPVNAPSQPPQPFHHHPQVVVPKPRPYRKPDHGDSRPSSPKPLSDDSNVGVSAPTTSIQALAAARRLQIERSNAKVQAQLAQINGTRDNGPVVDAAVTANADSLSAQIHAHNSALPRQLPSGPAPYRLSTNAQIASLAAPLIPKPAAYVRPPGSRPNSQPPAADVSSSDDSTDTDSDVPKRLSSLKKPAPRPSAVVPRGRPPGASRTPSASTAKAKPFSEYSKTATRPTLSVDTAGEFVRVDPLPEPELDQRSDSSASESKSPAKIVPLVPKGNFLYWEPEQKPGESSAAADARTSQWMAVSSRPTPAGARAADSPQSPQPLQPSPPPAVPVSSASAPAPSAPARAPTPTPTILKPEDLTFTIHRYLAPETKLVVMGSDIADYEAPDKLSWVQLLGLLEVNMRFDDMMELLVVNYHHFVENQDTLTEGRQWYRRENEVVIARCDSVGKPPRELMERIKAERKRLRESEV